MIIESKAAFNNQQPPYSLIQSIPALFNYSMIISFEYLIIESISALFYNLQDDGSILCEKREDCPDDVPDKVTIKIKLAGG